MKLKKTNKKIIIENIGVPFKIIEIEKNKISGLIKEIRKVIEETKTYKMIYKNTIWLDNGKK